MNWTKHLILKNNQSITKVTTMRTNTIVPISFGRDEVELLRLLDEGRKKEFQTRSGWVKDCIREKYGKNKDLQSI